MLQEAIVCTPSALDTQPFYFVVAESQEAKDKVDEMMWPVDKDRPNRCSFVVIPRSDAQWFEHFDEHVEIGRKETPEFWVPEIEAMVRIIVADWLDRQFENENAGLYKSVDFQAGLVTMSFLNTVCTHGYEAAFMDGWDSEMLGDLFGIDLERYRPHGVIAVGIGTDEGTDLGGQAGEGASTAATIEMFRYPAELKSIFF